MDRRMEKELHLKDIWTDGWRRSCTYKTYGQTDGEGVALTRHMDRQL